MDFLKPENIEAVINLVLPGLVAMLVYDELVPSERRDWSKDTVAAIVFGSVNYVLLKPAFQWLATQQLDVSWKGLGIFVVNVFVHLGFPVVSAFGMFRVKKWLAERGCIMVHPTPTAWDHAFSGRSKECWVRVRLRDGNWVGGRWAAGAFAGTSVNCRDLHLVMAQSLQEDGSFGDDPGFPRELLLGEEEIGIVEFLEDSTEAIREHSGSGAGQRAAANADDKRRIGEDGAEGVHALNSGSPIAARSAEGTDGTSTTAEKVGDDVRA